MVALRHYWNFNKKQCDCGCKDRVFIGCKWFCMKDLKERLELFGFTIIPTQKRESKIKLENIGVNAINAVSRAKLSSVVMNG